MATPKQVRRRGRWSVIIGLLFVALTFGAAAWADDISNNIDTTIDTVAEVMPLTTGGASGTTQLFVQPQNGDSKNGCNLTGSTTLVVSVSSSDTSVATVSPSSVTFTSCGGTPTLTVTPHNQGSATITLSQTSNTTGGTFDLAPATFTVNVTSPPSANTSPQLSITGVVGGASYDKGSVPAAACEVTDAEDGHSSFAATLGAISGPYDGDGIGQQTASCSYTDTGGLTASASVTYSIVDPTPPVISYVLNPASPEGANGWYRSDVTLTWTVTENESPGSLVKTGCDDQSITTDQDATTYSCSATSAGGSAGPMSVSIKRDATDPTITFDSRTAANGNGWNNTDVTVTWTCADALSGPVSASVDQTVSTEGANQSAQGTCYDNAGNSASDTQTGINIDETAPTVAYTSASPAPNANGWNNSNVVATFTATDTLSGFAGPSTTKTGTSTTSGEGSAVTVGSPAFTDLAANTAAAGAATSDPFKIDKTPPSVSLVGGPADGGSYYYGFVPAAPTCSASDALSGLDGACKVGGYGTAVGTHTVTASATDKADNSASASATYTVLAWTLHGFYQPVDMGGVFNTVKGGSTVPLKFEIFAGTTELTDTADVASLKSGEVGCNATAPSDTIETTATGGTSLRYDLTAGQFVYNWQTPKSPGHCYSVTMRTLDGSSLSAFFKLK